MSDADFEVFVLGVEPRLRRALLGAVGINHLDAAVGEALAFAYEHWDRLAGMANPVGYRFRCPLTDTVVLLRGRMRSEVVEHDP